MFLRFLVGILLPAVAAMMLKQCSRSGYVLDVGWSPRTTEIKESGKYDYGIYLDSL